jgi:hypothetical protein
VAHGNNLGLLVALGNDFRFGLGFNLEDVRDLPRLGVSLPLAFNPQ